MRRCAWCAIKFQPTRSGHAVGGWTQTCSKACAQYRRADAKGLRIHAGGKRSYSPEQLRAKNYRRRTARRQYDITPEYEAALRQRAKRCPMPGCDVRLTERPHQPTSKELDHIVPINMGGTHTIGNVRIICRRCNQSRPQDGSDYIGQLSLWADDPDALSPICACGVRKTKRHRCKPETWPHSKVHYFECADCGQVGVAQRAGRHLHAGCHNHGRAGYTTGCRCSICREAQRVYNAAWLARSDEHRVRAREAVRRSRERERTLRDNPLKSGHVGTSA